MTVKRVKCREHDGWFRVVVKPGRPPVRCSEDNRCDAYTPAKRHVVTKENTHSAADKRASVVSQLAKHTGLKESQIVITPSESAAETRSPRNRSVPLAQAAKAELEALGWTAKGRGWNDGGEEHSGADMAEVTAVRGSESLVITWNDGKVSRQDYNLWHNRRSLNGMPSTKLKFDVNEMTDRELIRAISGMKITWWNSLGKTEECYVVSGDKLSIEHFYASNGDEDTGRRIVKFIDLNGSGYRHFHAEALLKVG